MWLFQYFMKDPAKAAVAHRLCAKEDQNSQKEGKLTIYCQVVNYLLATYAIEDMIAEAEAEIMSFKQPEYVSVVRYLEVLWEKALRCDLVYGEEFLKGFFCRRTV